MLVKNTNIPGLKILIPSVHEDNRGCFYESFNQKAFENYVSFTPIRFVQDNQTISKKGVVRGMHWQIPPYDQAKLVRCVRGSIFDVAVDIRVKSPTFMQYACIELTESNHKQLFIPRGFAHGFVALTDNTIVQYKCDNFYNKEAERGFKYNTLGIPWPVMDCIIESEKDSENLSFDEIKVKDLFV